MTEQEQYERAVQIIRSAEKPGLSVLMRELKIGYNSAAYLLDKMEGAQIVTCIQTNGTRKLIEEKS